MPTVLIRINYIKKLNPMNYYINTKLPINIEAATLLIEQEIKKEGFGIVSRFDVDQALQEKLQLSFRKYRILGACNPAFAVQAIAADDKIGTILPCNIMIQATDEGVEIAIINAQEIIKGIENTDLNQIAKTITKKMQQVIKRLQQYNYATKNN